MIRLFIFLRLILLYNLKINDIKNEKENTQLKGVFRIDSFLNYYHFFINKNSLILSEEHSLFNVIKVESNSYYIESRRFKKIIAADDNNNIILIDKKQNINKKKTIWEIIKIKNNQYMIKNKYNKRFIGVSNDIFLFLLIFNFNTIINKNLLFSFVKYFEEKKLCNTTIINSEPIDIIIKYIDITDKNLKREGIHQIYKDQDNEELRYSIRSILLNIPWIRKIFILMPNKKVRFFKSIDEINEKIIYVQDKDLLGYDSANNVAFLFNLYKLEKFGISKNFIYMDDDYFFGKPLKKSDFFYYDEIEKKVRPYIITSKFKEVNKSLVLENYYKLFEKKNLIHPHSGKGFTLSILCTEKFFIDNYNSTLIKTENTHNAIAENIDDLKDIFELIKKYEYINETLFSKERYILRLSQAHFFNLYQLNIKQKMVHSIPYKYFKMESINKDKLDIPLFVINTGGNHMPLKRQYKMQKKIMEKNFYYHSQFENIQVKKENKNSHFYIIRATIILISIKIIQIFKIIIILNKLI